MRGFAALLVLYAHIVVVGTTDPVTPRLYLPMVPYTPLSGTQILAAEAFLRPEYFIERFRIVSGDLGVAIFFLISGFVIQGSLQTLSPGLFIGRRIFRIYPLTIFVVFITAIVLAAYCRLYGVQEPFTIHSTILSAFLLDGFFPNLYVLPVLWSLMVEISFYVLMAGIFLLSKKCSYLEMIIAGTSCLLLTYLGTDPPAAFLPIALQVRKFRLYGRLHDLYAQWVCNLSRSSDAERIHQVYCHRNRSSLNLLAWAGGFSAALP
jgi:peptidoglycan/LPS O-acetylase OafA/YrhL